MLCVACMCSCVRFAQATFEYALFMLAMVKQALCFVRQCPIVRAFPSCSMTSRSRDVFPVDTSLGTCCACAWTFLIACKVNRLLRWIHMWAASQVLIRL